MATIPQNINKHDVSLLWSQFLDDFRHADIDEKIKLIEEEPEWVDLRNGRWSYILAATAEALAHEAKIPVISNGFSIVVIFAIY